MSALPVPTADAAPTSSVPKEARDEMLLQHQVEQFYYLEAALLDDRRFLEWLDLLAPDLEYWMPARSTRSRAEMHLEFAKRGEGAFFDDDKHTMEMRVRKLDTGFAWAEDPPSRTRHLVTNVRVVARPSAAEVEVSSNFHLYRSRLSNDQDEIFGRRADRLRFENGAWRVVRRHIFVDHVSLDVKNLSVFI